MVLTHKIIESTIQSEGTQRIQVAFMDDLGKEHRRQYDFPEGADVDNEIQICKSHVEQGLKDQDIELATGMIESDESFELQYASKAELKLKLQERKVEIREEIDMLTSKKDKIDKELKAK